MTFQPEVGHEGWRREYVGLPARVGDLGVVRRGHDEHEDHDDDDEVDGGEDLLQVHAIHQFKRINFKRLNAEVHQISWSNTHRQCVLHRPPLSEDVPLEGGGELLPERGLRVVHRHVGGGRRLQRRHGALYKRNTLIICTWYPYFGAFLNSRRGGVRCVPFYGPR